MIDAFFNNMDGVWRQVVSHEIPAIVMEPGIPPQEPASGNRPASLAVWMISGITLFVLLEKLMPPRLRAARVSGLLMLVCGFGYLGVGA